jgi:hypothetical protein
MTLAGPDRRGADAVIDTRMLFEIVAQAKDTATRNANQAIAQAVHTKLVLLCWEHERQPGKAQPKAWAP